VEFPIVIDDLRGGLALRQRSDDISRHVRTANNGIVAGALFNERLHPFELLQSARYTPVDFDQFELHNADRQKMRVCRQAWPQGNRANAWKRPRQGQ
jgi:hypothetical protein